MKQTAIQHAIESVRIKIEALSWYDSMISKHKIHHLKQVERELYELLEEEREQIIRARQDGLDNGFSNGSWDSNLYYNETYGEK
jgi:flagellar biosynthesis/type III secretory pathway protein FliH